VIFYFSISIRFDGRKLLLEIQKKLDWREICKKQKFEFLKRKMKEIDLSCQKKI